MCAPASSLHANPVCGCRSQACACSLLHHALLNNAPRNQLPVSTASHSRVVGLHAFTRKPRLDCWLAFATTNGLPEAAAAALARGRRTANGSGYIDSGTSA